MRFWGKTAVEQNRIERLIDNLPKEGAWQTGLSEAEEILLLEAEEKRRLRYHAPIPKEGKTINVYFPTDIDRSHPPYWKTAPDVLRVNIATGEVLVDKLSSVVGCFAYEYAGEKDEKT